MMVCFGKLPIHIHDGTRKLQLSTIEFAKDREKPVKILSVIREELDRISFCYVGFSPGSNAVPVSAGKFYRRNINAASWTAERAKQRRQQEEDERGKQMERARQKATEIEEKLRMSALAKTPDKPTDEPKPSDTEVSILHINRIVCNS